MLTPKWLSGCSDSIVALYEEAERSILDDMARRIRTYDFYIPAAQYQEEKLAMMGMTRKEIVRALAARTGKCTAEIERIMEEGVYASLNRDRSIYRSAGKAVSRTMSAEMKAILRDGLKQTGGTFQKLTRTTANTATKQFENALDLAWIQVSTGAMDADAAARQAVKSLCRDGIQAVTYPTGQTDSLETAVARAIRTGVNQTALKSQEQLAFELDMDLVEVTAHAGARPSHAEWQGQVYSLTGKTRGYEKLADATGYGTGEGLGGWNCRHSFFPWSPEMGHTYTRKELEEYERPDAVEYGGRKMSLYEAEQTQRGIERNIRRWKREESAMKAARLDASEASGKLKQWNDRYKDFCSKTGLKTQRQRLSIESFKMSGATTRRTEKLVKQTAEAYTKKQEEVRKLIQSGEIPKKLNRGNQNKHILGSSGYIEGRSYVYGDLEDMQKLVDQYSGTGNPKLRRNLEWTNKEFVTLDIPVGVTIDPETGKKVETRRFAIHYGKKGTHIVPMEERKNK